MVEIEASNLKGHLQLLLSLVFLQVFLLKSLAGSMPAYVQVNFSPQLVYKNATSPSGDIAAKESKNLHLLIRFSRYEFSSLLSLPTL